MTLREKQSLFAHNIGKLIMFAYEQGYELTVGEANRTEYQQREYVRQGLSKTMNSRHRLKLAMDLNLFLNGEWLVKTKDYKPLGEYWVSLHPDNVWGGDFNKNGREDDALADGNHFEMKP